MLCALASTDDVVNPRIDILFDMIKELHIFVCNSVTPSVVTASTELEGAPDGIMCIAEL